MRRALFAATAMLLLTSTARAQAVLTGVVLTDSTKQPIANAEVSLPILSKTALTDEKGEFRIDGIAPGVQQIRIRRLGYGEFNGHVNFTKGEIVRRTVYLRHVVTLDSVVVNAAASAEETRRSGFGHVLTRDDLAKHESQQLSDVLSHVPGVEVVRGVSGHAWIASSRGPGSSMNPNGAPLPLSREDVLEGAKQGKCYAQVYLDGALVYAGASGELFDINSVQPASIESIEYFAGPAQTPTRYMRLNSGCGVVVIHSRRGPVGASVPLREPTQLL